MSLATHCDGPDCNTWANGLFAGWLEVGPIAEIASESDYQHFCSWDCVLRYAAAKEPMTTIPMESA